MVDLKAMRLHLILWSPVDFSHQLWAVRVDSGVLANGLRVADG